MRYLILSDIHSNLEALEAVMANAQGQYDEIVCCGDLVGYGPDPNAVVDWTREHVKHIVRGNHDKACTGSEDLEWFNPVARYAAEWTLSVLTAQNADYLRRLPKGPVRVNGFEILHGSPLDEDDYLVSIADVTQLVPYLEASLSFFGHTHLQGGFLCHRSGVMRIGRVPSDEDTGIFEIEPDRSYLINPGSVGQPRDGDWRAAYLIYEVEDGLVYYNRVPYPVEATQDKILQAGLPEMLAQRLALGS